MARITKKHVASAIRKTMGLTTIEPAEYLDELLSTVAEALSNSGSVDLGDYGSFTIRRAGLRLLSDPRSAKRVKAVSPRIVQFIPSKTFNVRLLGVIPPVTKKQFPLSDLIAEQFPVNVFFAALPGDPTTDAPRPIRVKPQES